MRVRERLISDLKEEILFQLSIQGTELITLTLVERVSQEMNHSVSLARVHETLIQLKADGLTGTIIVNAKKNYIITPAGIATLQTDWSNYKRSINGL